MASTDSPPPSIVQRFIAEASRCMKEQGISQAELARRLTCTKAYVHKLLKGEENLTAATMEKLAESLGLELAVTVHRRRNLNSHDRVEPGADAEPASPSGTEASEILRSLHLLNAIDARAFLDKCGSEARSAIYKVVQDATSQDGKKSKPGRKKGSGANCYPQMIYMARLLEGENPPSEREASRRAEEWAAEQRAAADQDAENLPELLSAETLRGRFRRNKEAYLVEARRILAQQRTEAPATAATEGTLGTGERRPAAVAGNRRASGSSRAVREGNDFDAPLSSLKSVRREIDLLAGRYGLSDQSLTLLRKPGVLEEIGRLNEIAEVAAMTAPLTPESISPMAEVTRHVNEAGETIRSLMSDHKITTAHDELGELLRATRPERVEDAVRWTSRQIEHLVGRSARLWQPFTW